MKKVQKVLCFLLVAITAMAILTACPAPSQPNNEGGVAIVVKIGDASYDVTTEKSYIGEVLDELVIDKGLNLKASGTADSDMGRWLNEIGTLVADFGNSAFIMFYLTSSDPNYAEQPPVSKIVDGVTYYSAGKGIDKMPVIDGVTYLFMLETF